jgi:hypothetical protein
MDSESCGAALDRCFTSIILVAALWRPMGGHPTPCTSMTAVSNKRPRDPLLTYRQIL